MWFLTWTNLVWNRVKFSLLFLNFVPTRDIESFGKFKKSKLNGHFSPIKTHPSHARCALDDANLMVVLIESNGRHHPTARMFAPVLEHRIARFLIRPLGERRNIIPSETTHLRNEPVVAAQASELDLGDIVEPPVGQAGVLPKERVREIHIAMLDAWMARLEQLRHRTIHRSFVIQRVIQFDPDPRPFAHLFITSLM